MYYAKQHITTAAGLIEKGQTVTPDMFGDKDALKVAIARLTELDAIGKGEAPVEEVEAVAESVEAAPEGKKK